MHPINKLIEVFPATPELEPYAAVIAAVDNNTRGQVRLQVFFLFALFIAVFIPISYKNFMAFARFIIFTIPLILAVGIGVNFYYLVPVIKSLPRSRYYLYLSPFLFFPTTFRNVPYYFIVSIVLSALVLLETLAMVSMKHRGLLGIPIKIICTGLLAFMTAMVFFYGSDLLRLTTAERQIFLMLLPWDGLISIVAFLVHLLLLQLLKWILVEILHYFFSRPANTLEYPEDDEVAPVPLPDHIIYPVRAYA